MQRHSKCSCCPLAATCVLYNNSNCAVVFCLQLLKPKKTEITDKLRQEINKVGRLCDGQPAQHVCCV